MNWKGRTIELIVYEWFVFRKKMKNELKGLRNLFIEYKWCWFKNNNLKNKNYRIWMIHG